MVKGGPLDASEGYVLMAFFMVREIEGAFAQMGDVTLDRALKVVKWHLPVSKTDPTATGTSRSWGCICRSRQDPCPYHAAERHIGQLLVRDVLLLSRLRVSSG